MCKFCFDLTSVESLMLASQLFFQKGHTEFKVTDLTVGVVVGLISGLFLWFSPLLCPWCHGFLFPGLLAHKKALLRVVEGWYHCS